MRFRVRAITPEQISSRTEASMTFVIRRPFWERPWFVALTLALGIASGFAAYRLRKAHRLAIDRIRSRIAADLHDDIGATLTQIVLLSEKILKAVATQESGLRDYSSRMVTISRGLVDSLSDFVWSIDAGKDGLSDLSLRMRSYAREMLEDAGLILRFDPPDRNDTRKLKSAVRRQLYLIFKEAIQNAVRHARAAEVHITLTSRPKQISLKIADDGIGFSAKEARGLGNGLENMALRTSDIGGTLQIGSERSKGTAVQVEIPFPFEQRFSRVQRNAQFDSAAQSQPAKKAKAAAASPVRGNVGTEDNWPAE